MKQQILASEPYFVHVGYTYICEMKIRAIMRNPKLKKFGYGRLYVNLKMRPVVAKRLAKLQRYHRMALL